MKHPCEESLGKPQILAIVLLTPPPPPPLSTHTHTKLTQCTLKIGLEIPNFWALFDHLLLPFKRENLEILVKSKIIDL
jgi:hypothetical protein